MRRGLLKDLANIPTQIACGWRLYGDLPRLRELAGRAITVNLLDGTTFVDRTVPVQPLQIAEETSRWLIDRLERDGVPAGLVRRALLTLTPHLEGHGLRVMCHTLLETELETYNSSAETRW